MNDKHIVNIVTEQISYFENLIRQEKNDRIKLYYHYMLSSLLKIRFSYTGEIYSAVHLTSSVRRLMQDFMIKKENIMIETIGNSREFIRTFSENLMDYVNETNFCYEESNTTPINDNNFIDIMGKMLKEEKIDHIYSENVGKEILDLNSHSDIGKTNFNAAYYLLSLDGNHLIVVNNSSKNVNSLLNYSHEYGHFLADYLLKFDIQKTAFKNCAYNEIVSEILHMKLRRIMLDNNYMSFEREIKEEYSFISEIFILYIYSHYDIIGNKRFDNIVKQAIADTAQKYSNIKININSFSIDSIIRAYNYGIARYIGSLYEIKNLNVLGAKDICTYDSENPLTSFSSIGIDTKNFIDSSTIKSNASKILIRK